MWWGPCLWWQLRKLREKLKKAEAGVEVGLAEFAEVAEDLHRCRARTVCTLAGVSFGEAMEEALFRALGQGRKGAGVWHDEALHLHPLHALAALDPKARAQHLMPLAVQVLPEVVARLVRSVGAEEEYAVEQKEIPDTQGKFNNAMVLCTPELFRVGARPRACASASSHCRASLSEPLPSDLGTRCG